MPPNKNLTLNFCIPLNAVPNIDKIVFPVAGPQFGDTDKILKGPNATTLVSLQ